MGKLKIYDSAHVNYTIKLYFSWISVYKTDLYFPIHIFRQQGLVGYILTIYYKISAISRIVLLKKATGCYYNLLCNKKYELWSYKSNNKMGSSILYNICFDYEIAWNMTVLTRVVSPSGTLLALTKTSSRSPSRIQKCRIQDFKSAISLDSLDGF